MRDFTLDPDADGLNNLIEFTLDLHPGEFSRMPEARLEGGSVVLEVALRQQDCPLSRVTFQYSTDLLNWIEVPAENITEHSDGSIRVDLPPQGDATFLRLLVTSL